MVSGRGGLGLKNPTWTPGPELPHATLKLPPQEQQLRLFVTNFYGKRHPSRAEQFPTSTFLAHSLGSAYYKSPRGAKPAGGKFRSRSVAYKQLPAASEIFKSLGPG